MSRFLIQSSHSKITLLLCGNFCARLVAMSSETRLVTTNTLIVHHQCIPHPSNTMKESTNPVPSLSHQKRIELELLHAVLVNGDAAYPWTPADPATSAYFDNLEATLVPDLDSEATSEAQWRSLAQKAEQLWANHSPSLATVLIQQFGARMPSHLLTQLATTAQRVSEDGLALIDQLVTCASDVVNGWNADDLRVMARPLAMAMRDGQGEIMDLTLRSVRQTHWDDLSEIEQARLSLAIARYALKEVSLSE